jgi:hypothetical protein
MIALLLIAVAGCHRVTGHAADLIDRGELAEADRILVTELNEHPTNLEAHFLLGKVRLLRNHPADAAAEFKLVEVSPDYRTRVADVYWRTASSPQLENEAVLVGHCLERAVKLESDLRAPACIRALTIARRFLMRGDDVRGILTAGASLDTHCKTKALSFAESAIRDNDRALDPEFAKSLGATAVIIDQASSLRIASAMRDRAATLSRRDPDTALALLKNALATDWSIDNDPSTRALRAQFTTGPPLVASGSSVSFVARSPLEATLAALESTGWAIMTYAEDAGEFPPAGDLEVLRRKLVPRYLSALPYDGWGSALVYARSGWDIRLISAGSDHILTPQSIDFTVAPRGLLDPGGGDIIWEDGAIVQRPAEDTHLTGRPQ